MKRAVSHAGAVALGLLAWDVRGQAEPPVMPVSPAPDPASAEDVALERYLESSGLDEVLAAHLRARIERAEGAERSGLAERLSRVYTRLLARAPSPAERERLETMCRELLAKVPESESLGLRVDLARTQYLRAEEAGERFRLRLLPEEDRVEALRTLKAVRTVFERCAEVAGRRVDALERREQSGREAELRALREDLAEARRVRSLSRFYAGWACVYQSLIEKDPDAPRQALVHFGFLLNASLNKPPALDRVPRGSLRFEHVARAVVGVAMAHAALDNPSEAMRWLDALDSAEALPASLTRQLPIRRLQVLAVAGQWPDIEALTRRLRRDEAGKERPLEPLEARLLGVLALEARTVKEGLRPGLVPVVDGLTRTAMGDLIAREQIGHIKDLVDRFGTAVLDKDGFIVQYVRGLQEMEKARDLHRASGKLEEPATTTEARAGYRAAAGLFASANSGQDASRFAAHRARAAILEGLCRYSAGDTEDAAKVFQAAVELAQKAPESALEESRAQRRDALWYAIVALDAAVEKGKASLAETRDRLAVLYLGEFPGTENAARLLLRPRTGGLIGDEQALTILLGVERQSPVYVASRRQAAVVLYRLYRASPAAQREFAAVRFLEVVVSVLDREREEALGAPGVMPSREAAERFIVRSRQAAEAQLALSSPDVARAESHLAEIESVARVHAISLESIGAEMAFWRLRIALARDDWAGAERLGAVIASAAQPGRGVFEPLARRALWAGAVDRLAREPESKPRLERLVAVGRRLIESAPKPSGDAAPANDGLDGVRDATARAATDLVNSHRAGREMRDLALEIDQDLVARGRATAAGLKRLAENAEAAGQQALALDSWKRLSSALVASEPAWFEARYNAMRLEAASDGDAAVVAMRQHRLLYPSFGPPPWGEKLAELDQAIRKRTGQDTSPDVAPAGGGKSQGGGA